MPRTDLKIVFIYFSNMDAKSPTPKEVENSISSVLSFLLTQNSCFFFKYIFIAKTWKMWLSKKSDAIITYLSLTNLLSVEI